MRFFLGDDNGQLKSARCTQAENEWKVDVALLDDGGKQGKKRAIQRLSLRHEQVAVARSDGSLQVFKVKEDVDSAVAVKSWQESRFKHGEKFIGLNLMTERVISCTEAGHLRLTQLEEVAEGPTGQSSQTTSIPTRLCDWVLSEDAKNFAYGGEEVEVSVWDTSRAFDSGRRLLPGPATGNKRRNGDRSELIDGEIWRAKNVSNDFLNLRQPVHNTSLAYITPTIDGKGPSHHLLAGTRLGSVRRYDTRAARKPVADWKEVGKVGGIKTVQRGNSEYEAFAADHGSNLVALDLRTGHTLCAYSGLAGAISCLAPTGSSPSLLASTSLDRFFRLHSTPFHTAGGPIKRGEVLSKVWIKSAASCVAWDGRVPVPPKENTDDEEIDDVWENMEHVDEEGGTSADEDGERGPKSKKRKAG